MQQHNQIPRNEILWREAEASVLPLLANRAQIGAACHLLSIPAASPLLELRPQHSSSQSIPTSAAQQPELSLPCTWCPVLERTFHRAGHAVPGSQHAFFLHLGSPQHHLGQSSQALVPAEELQSSAHHGSPAGQQQPGSLALLSRQKFRCRLS